MSLEEKRQFMKDYILARASTISDKMSGKLNPLEANNAWLEIERQTKS